MLNNTKHPKPQIMTAFAYVPKKLKISYYDANIATETKFVPGVGEVEVAKITELEFDVNAVDDVNIDVGRSTTVLQTGIVPGPA